MINLDERESVLFEELYNTYAQYIRNSIKKMGGTTEIAEEAVQDIFVMLWDKRHEAQQIRNHKTYLYAMARNYMVNHHRKKMRVNTAIKEFAYDQDYDNSRDKALTRDCYDLIGDEIINELPPQRQKILRMVLEHGLSHKHVASRLAISPLTVKDQMKKALRHLRVKLEKCKN